MIRHGDKTKEVALLSEKLQKDAALISHKSSLYFQHRISYSNNQRNQKKVGFFSAMGLTIHFSQSINQRQQK